MKEEIQESTRTGTDSEWYQGWDISPSQRARYSEISRKSYQAKVKALKDNEIGQYQKVNVPTLDPMKLMPKLKSNQLKMISLFSGGGGLDLGFDRAGFKHVASYEILDFAAESIRLNRPSWKVYGSEDGDVKKVDWNQYRGKIDIVHGGPPCQPFSMAGRQKGKLDSRDMIPEFVRCVKETQPAAFVMENVFGLTSEKFRDYLDKYFYSPLSSYHTTSFVLNAASFGVPQIRKRVFFVGFLNSEVANNYVIPIGGYSFDHLKRVKTNLDLFSSKKCQGVRESLGLEDTGYDTLAPTLRCSLTGPRSTTSILSSTSAQKVWRSIGIWPNGVQDSREKASAFETKDGTHRLSIYDCAILQGFPESWKFNGPVYQVLGQIGNSVAPPMGYAVAKSVSQAFSSK